MTDKALSTKYDHRSLEAHWQQEWEARGTYRWDESATREDSFVIDTPPPTVSGVLHMGHIFSYCQADFVARFQRMQGKSVFYPMGFDDNGLPTERLVEKTRKIRGASMDREAFIAICREVVEEAESEFHRLFSSIALSVDWTQLYQTISPRSRTLSQLSFLDLHRKGHAYRRMQPMLWDPVDRTALAQADVVDSEMKGVFHDIAFTIEQSGEEALIATTRPELLPACVAVMFHPEDARYRSLTGKRAITPLFRMAVPFIADDRVDPEKGTGLVMCCTFGDQTDMEWQRDHDLPLRIVLDKAGRMTGLERLYNGEWPAAADQGRAKEFAQALEGLKTAEARKQIAALLEEEGLLKETRPITHSVKCAERSGAPLEILVTPQWFIRIMDKKEALLERVRQVQWHPEHMRIRAEQWIEGLSWDWCISRQRFFGVPFPVWYAEDEKGETRTLLADPSQLPVDPLRDLPLGYKLESRTEDGSIIAIEEATGARWQLTPDQDVMDTWATSSVSPQLSSHGITEELGVDPARHRRLFPADLRPQAHEIIRTWAFYTIVKAHLHEDTIPWRDVMISGWCLAPDKTKMSKSKGNVITPVDLIEEKGADVVRYWASTSHLGADTAYSESVLKIGKKLVTKLWNATRFAALHLEKRTGAHRSAAEETADSIICEALDQWVLGQLHRATARATTEFARFEYCRAREAIEDFFWNDFCDNYLELIKSRAYDEAGEDPTGQRSAIHTIYHCVETVLRLFAPFVPHVTEELYGQLFPARHQAFGSIHTNGTWPESTDYPTSATATQTGEAVLAVLETVRRLKSQQEVSLKWPLEAVRISPGSAGQPGHWEELAPAAGDLRATIHAANLNWSPEIALSGGTLSEDGRFLISATFAKQSDVA